MSGNGEGFSFGEIEFVIKGVTQHTQHNPRTVNPRDPITKAIKEFTKKKKKTDEDNDAIANLEWEAGLYIKDGKIGVPGNLIEGALCEAGRKSNQGKQVQAGLWSPGFWPLDFPDKKKTIDELRDMPQYLWICRVGVKTSSIMRARPVFPVWGLTFRVCYEKDVFSAHDVVNLVEVLGKLVGLSDCRAKRGGRFDVVKATEIR